MSDTRRRLMDATVAEIIAQEGLAQELAEFAHLVGQDGHHATAQMFRKLSRQKCVKGLELRGNLAVLRAGDREIAEDDA